MTKHTQNKRVIPTREKLQFLVDTIKSITIHVSPVS